MWRDLVKASPYSITERRVPELIPVLCSQPAADVSHKPGGRLPLLSARPAVPSQPLGGLLPVSLLGEQRGTVGVNNLPKTVTRQRRGCNFNPGPTAPESSTLTTRLPSHPGPSHNNRRFLGPTHANGNNRNVSRIHNRISSWAKGAVSCWNG